jgi:glycosyltransferase involved in cell wall biosynthesis
MNESDGCARDASTCLPLSRQTTKTHMTQKEEREPITGKFKSTPVVSIGMPLFNCEKTLGTALRSILKQTFQNWELLIIDDGSTDQTREVARSFEDPRVRVIADGEHRGLVARLNQAIDLGSGKYFARMDGDDVAFPDRLRRQADFLTENARIDLVGCGILVFGDSGRVLGVRHVAENHTEICGRPWAGFHLPHPTWMGRIEWFRSHRYDAKAVRAEDQELLLRTYSTSCFSCLPEILQGYREDQLVLRNILRGRYSFTIAVLRDFFEQKRYLTAIGGALGQCTKALVDVLAISTGLNHRILRHRARPARTEIVEDWSDVWERVQDYTESILPYVG